MERLQSLEEYKALLKDNKQLYRCGYQNNYLGAVEINRYIQLQRIFYEVNETGLFFFTDEEKYYRLYLYTMAEGELRMEKPDKPVLVRTVYRENNKPELLVRVEGQLKKAGFCLYDQSVQILANPLDNKDVIRQKYDRAIKFLHRAGIDIIYAGEEYLKDILKLRDDAPELKPYHFAYESPEEMAENIRNEYYRCAVTGNGELCAAQQFAVVNGTIQGNWLAVKSEYKVKYGIGTAMAYHSFMYAIDHGISNYYGWVVIENSKSITYHKNIGYELCDKIADEWLLL